MYHAHPYFSLKNLGKSVHYTQRNMVFLLSQRLVICCSLTLHCQTSRPLKIECQGSRGLEAIMLSLSNDTDHEITQIMNVNLCREGPNSLCAWTNREQLPNRGDNMGRGGEAQQRPAGEQANRPVVLGNASKTSGETCQVTAVL